MARLLSLSICVLLLLFGQRSLLAQLPVARLLTLFPPGGKSGSQFEVSLTGLDLDEANQLHFSQPGITAKQKKDQSNGAAEPNKFVVTIASNTPPGIYEARVVGRFGISNPRSFVVSDLPEATAPSTNHSSANAAAIAFGAIVNGLSEPDAASFYKFSARKSQRVLIECEAREIDSRMDATMVLLDAAGKELGHSRNGGLINFTAPADGEYYLKVHDFLFRGGSEYFYRLIVSARPHIDFVFPPSGLPGAKSKHLLYGRNLPGGTAAHGIALEGQPLDQLEVEIEFPREPARQFSTPQKLPDATLDAFEYFLTTPQGVSNPILLGFATGTVVPEREPNDRPAQAQIVTPPCEYVGQFYPARDQDWVTFEAKKGELYWVEVFSQRLGLPTSPFVLVQRVTKNEKGEEQVSDVKELYASDSNIGGADYKTLTRDPAGRFEIPENGACRIEVRDLFNTSKSDARLVYRLSIRKETPDFRLVAVPQPPPSANKDSKEILLWSPLLRRGETMPVRVMAFRRDNFNGDIELKAENLPAGISCSEAKIEKDKNSAMLMLTAADNAAEWVGSLKIVGRAKIGETEVVRDARGATVNWAVADYDNEPIQSRLTRDFVLAVSGLESAPISVASAETKVWESAEGGKLTIPLRLTRRAEFNANLKLKAVGIGALDNLKEIDLDGKATNATIEIDLKEHKIPAGSYNFYLQTQTQGKYRNNPEAAKAAEEALKQAEKLVADLTAALKAAPELKMAATRAASESALKAKAASEASAEAARTASEAEALARAASEKLASAKIALEEKAADQDLAGAKDAATKAAEEAQSKSKAALEAKSIADKAAAEAQAKAKADAQAQIAAEKSEAELPARLKDAENKKELAANRAKETAKIAEPRDVTITVYSAPINLRILQPSASSAK